MKWDLADHGRWDELNEELRAHLKIQDPKVKVRFSRGVLPGLTDIIDSLSALFVWQKSVFFISETTPYNSMIGSVLAKSGYHVTHVPVETIEQPEEFVSKLSDDTLFVMMSSDQPLTGRKFQVERLISLLAEKKIYSICVSHDAKLEMNPFLIQVNAIARDLAVVCFGSRARIDIPMQAYYHWSKDVIDRTFSSRPQDNKEKIIEFEKQKDLGFVPFFSEQREDRIYDRAVIVFEDIDGFAFIEVLAELLGLQLLGPGFDFRIETLSLCRWGGIKTMDWIKSSSINDKMIRGMIIISQELLDYPQFIEKFKQAREKIIKLQS